MPWVTLTWCILTRGLRCLFAYDVIQLSMSNLFLSRTSDHHVRSQHLTLRSTSTSPQLTKGTWGHFWACLCNRWHFWKICSSGICPTNMAETYFRNLNYECGWTIFSEILPTDMGETYVQESLTYFQNWPQSRGRGRERGGEMLASQWYDTAEHV